jgi:hypothetical protein
VNLKIDIQNMEEQSMIKFKEGWELKFEGWNGFKEEEI